MNEGITKFKENSENVQISCILHKNVKLSLDDYKNTKNKKLADFVKRNKEIDNKETFVISNVISKKLVDDIYVLLKIDIRI